MNRVSPTYRAIAQPEMLLGGEYRLVGGNIAIALFMLLMVNLYYWLVIALAAHILFVQIAKKEPAMRKIYLGYSHQADRYEPWTASDPRSGYRPVVLLRGGELL